MNNHTMMESLSRAAQANEAGARMLEQEDTNDALKHFRQGLKYLNEGCRSIENGLPSTTAAAGADDNAAALITIPMRAHPVRVGRNHQVAHSTSASAPRLPAVLYSEAFLFGESLEGGEFTLEQHTVFSAILIFNTALALHQKAGNEQGRHKAYLKALLFYRESMKLLQPMEQQAEAFRIIQEILKNLADIYYALNDLANVQLVWEELAILTKERNLPDVHKNVQVALSA